MASESESYQSEGSDDTNQLLQQTQKKKKKKPLAKKGGKAKPKADASDSSVDTETLLKEVSKNNTSKKRKTAGKAKKSESQSYISDDSDDTAELLNSLSNPKAAVTTSKKKSRVSKTTKILDSEVSKSSAESQSDSEDSYASLDAKPKVSSARKRSAVKTKPIATSAKKPKVSSKTSSAKPKAKSTKVTDKQETNLSSVPDYNSMDIVLPPNAGSEISILVQIDPDDAAQLDFTGAVGAVGRLETDQNGVMLDLKGCQYRGSIFPGPTALVLAAKPFQKTNDAPQLRVDCIVDEFCRLVKESDHMETLAGKVKGDMMDYNYHYQEEDVNRRADVVATEEGRGSNGKDAKSSKRGAGKTKRK